MTIYGYLRTSTDDQVYGIEAQREDILAAYPEAMFYEEHASGKAGSNRPQFEAVLDRVCRERAVLVVSRADRLGRSTVEVLQSVERVMANGGHVVILQMGADTRTSTGKMVLTLLAGFAELERSFIQERVRAGLGRARAAGKQLGGARTLGLRADGSSTGKVKPRAPVGRRLTPAEAERRVAVRRYLAEGLPVVQVARLAGCSESLVRKVRDEDRRIGTAMPA